jgi:hypothetical protein
MEETARLEPAYEGTGDSPAFESGGDDKPRTGSPLETCE